jgi:hypothetical protein
MKWFKFREWLSNTPEYTKLTCMGCGSEVFVEYWGELPGDWAWRFYDINDRYQEVRRDWMYGQINKMTCSRQCFEDCNAK